MSISDGFVGSVGNTPLIRLRGVSEETGCEILGKAEFMNPGGSVKDRAARAIIAAAERRGQLPPKGTVVEGTAGNTGIGLAHVCNERGYRCVIVMPDNQAPEKYRILEMLGAEVLQGTDCSLQQPESVSESRATAGGFFAQCDLVEPVRQYGESGSPRADHGARNLEPDQRTLRRVCCRDRDGWHVCRRLRISEVTAQGRAVCVSDPPGSALYEYVRNGTLKSTDRVRSPKVSASGA